MNAFNLAFARRKTVDVMEARKLAMISGLYANTNLDDDKGTRSKIIGELEDQFAEAIANLYDPQPEVELKGNPFFDAMNVPGSELSDEEIASYGGANPADGLTSGAPPMPMDPKSWDIDQDLE